MYAECVCFTSLFLLWTQSPSETPGQLVFHSESGEKECLAGIYVISTMNESTNSFIYSFIMNLSPCRYSPVEFAFHSLDMFFNHSSFDKRAATAVVC